MSFITKSQCCECGETEYHISLASEDVTYEPEDGFHLHLTEDLARLLYIELKEQLIYDC